MTHIWQEPHAHQQKGSSPFPALSSLKQWIWHVQSGADASETHSSALRAKADTLTFMSAQLAWLQEQVPTMTLGYFCTIGRSCMAASIQPRDL